MTFTAVSSSYISPGESLAWYLRDVGGRSYSTMFQPGSHLSRPSVRTSGQCGSLKWQSVQSIQIVPLVGRPACGGGWAVVLVSANGGIDPMVNWTWSRMPIGDHTSAKRSSRIAPNGLLARDLRTRLHGEGGFSESAVYLKSRLLYIRHNFYEAWCGSHPPTAAPPPA